MIPDQQDMNRFLKFLLHRMRSIDGNRGSAEKLLELLNEKDMKEYKIASNKNFISESIKQKIM